MAEALSSWARHVDSLANREQDVKSKIEARGNQLELEGLDLLFNQGRLLWKIEPKIIPIDLCDALKDIELPGSYSNHLVLNLSMSYEKAYSLKPEHYPPYYEAISFSMEPADAERSWNTSEILALKEHDTFGRQMMLVVSSNQRDVRRLGGEHVFPEGLYGIKWGELSNLQMLKVLNTLAGYYIDKVSDHNQPSDVAAS